MREQCIPGPGPLLSFVGPGNEGRTVVCPVVPELASSFNWCGSQNLVVSVALSSSPSMYGSFLPVQSLSAEYSTGDKFARVFLCLKVSLILLVLVSMERIPWTNQEQDIYLYHGHSIAENHTSPSGSGGFPR